MLTQAQKSSSPFVNPYAATNAAASRYAGVQTPPSSYRPQEPQPPALPPSPEPPIPGAAQGGTPVYKDPTAPEPGIYGVPSVIPPKPMGGAEFYVQERLAAAGGFSMSGKDRVGGMAAKRGADKGKTREQIESDARRDWERMGPTERDAYFKKASPSRSKGEQQAYREYDQAVYGTGTQGTQPQGGQAPGAQGSPPSPSVSYAGPAGTPYAPNDAEFNAGQRGYRTGEDTGGKNPGLGWLRTPAEVAARNAEVNGTYGAMGPRVKYDSQGVTSDASMTKVAHPDGSITIATPYGMGSSRPQGAKGAQMGVPVSPQAPPVYSPSAPTQAPQSPPTPTRQPWQGQPPEPVAPPTQAGAAQVTSPAAAPWSGDYASTAGVGQSFPATASPEPMKFGTEIPSETVYSPSGGWAARDGSTATAPLAYRAGAALNATVGATADALDQFGQSAADSAASTTAAIKAAPGKIVNAGAATGEAVAEGGGNFFKGLMGAPMNARPLTGSRPEIVIPPKPAAPSAPRNKPSGRR